VSYGIYLWHLFAIELWLHIGGFEPAQFLVLTFGLTLLLAAASWHFFEKPVLEFGRRVSGPKAPLVQAVPSARR
jgi:peptidoglycan/LPS O-acetylase OafA/YrhL